MTHLEDEIVQSLRRIVRAIDVHSRSLSREFELTWPQLAALRELERVGQCPVGRLASEMYIGAPTVTGIVDRLERDGLVERLRGQGDRRKVIVALTEQGRRLLAKRPSLLNESFREQLAALPEPRRNEVLATLEQLARMMEGPEGSNGEDGE